jgi:two-component system phosphate regulon response regulator PhoB
LRRVLLIDDTPQIAELLTFALRDRGYDVVTSDFAIDVDRLAAEHRVEAVVLDCSVYDASESLFDTLRQDERHVALPVVIITDTLDDAVASLRARKAQRVLLVPKPFTGGQVAHALDQLLEPDEGPDQA